MSEALNFWAEISPLISHIKDDLTAWMDEYKIESIFDEEVSEEFINNICLYMSKHERKKTEKWVRDKLDKTYEERVKQSVPYAGKLGLELIKMPTKKGRVLIDMLMDFTNHPEEYLHKATKTSATLDDVDSVLDTMKLTKEARKEAREKLLLIIKK